MKLTNGSMFFKRLIGLSIKVLTILSFYTLPNRECFKCRILIIGHIELTYFTLFLF